MNFFKDKRSYSSLNFYFLAIFSEISLQQSFVHSHLLDGIPLRAYAEFIIHSTADGHLSSFQFKAIMNKVVINICLQVFLHKFLTHFCEKQKSYRIGGDVNGG